MPFIARLDPALKQASALFWLSQDNAFCSIALFFRRLTACFRLSLFLIQKVISTLSHRFKSDGLMVQTNSAALKQEDEFDFPQAFDNLS
jgi:hypothetical protein